MKKALKIIGIVVLVLIILLIAAPFLFKGTIEKQVKKAINKNVNASVEWSDLSLSLFSSFPDARLKLEDVSVINKAPFEGDTLVYGKTIFLDMGIPQLFKGGDEPLSINSLGLNEAYINVIVNKEGKANYDIAKESDKKKEPEKEGESDISLDVKHYEINNSRINYLDEKSKMFLRISKLNHEGTGDFSANTSTLHTKTTALVSFTMDTVNYLDKNSLKLDADIKMDLDDMKFSFEKNKAMINQLPLTFDGYVKINDDNQELDLTFQTPSSDFKNFLGLIPETYTQSLKGVETSGDFSVKGKLYGVIDDDHIPKMNIAMHSNNASFKYPDLPKKVQNINIDAVLKDETGLMKDMNLDLNKLTFKIDQDVFSAHGKLQDLTGNMRINLNANGTLNLANIDKAYPIDTELNLSGILKADLSTSFAMDDIEKERYQNIKSKGSASIIGFNYDSDEMANPVKISKASLSFDPGKVVLKQFDLTTGQTDAHLSGQLENFMGYLFKNQPIKGNFHLTSGTFSVNDFMVTETEEQEKNKEEQKKKSQNTTAQEAIKIPSFLDIALDFKADKVLYDNLTLTHAKGALVIRDETATLKHITADIFGGSIGLDGSVATKTKTPKFNMDLSLNKINITQSVQQMELLNKFAPIMNALIGDLSTTINLNGDLTPDLSPIYASLAGKGVAEILNAKVEKDKLPLVSKLGNKLDFLKLDNLNLKDITTHFTFKDGGIDIQPYSFNINKDIKAEVSGRHTFENQMDYVMDLNVPAKYLGKDINQALSKLSNSKLKNSAINIPVEMEGSIKNPKIKVDLKSATNTLINKIAEEQKENLKNKAKDKLEDLFNKGKKKEDNKTSDQAREDDKKNEKSDKEKVKEKAKNALEGLFGKKKKKDQKDEKGKK